MFREGSLEVYKVVFFFISFLLITENIIYVAKNLAKEHGARNEYKQEVTRFLITC